MLIICMILQPVFLRRIALVGNDGTAKIEGIPVFVEHNLRRVHVFQCLETIIYRKGFHQSGYLGGRVVETCFDGL